MQFTQCEKKDRIELIKSDFAVLSAAKIAQLFVFLLALVLALVVAFVPAKAFAATYELPQTVISAQVTEQGSIVVSEQRTITFTGETPYISWSFKDLPTGSSLSVKSMSIAEGSSASSELSSVVFDSEWYKSLTKDNMPSTQCYSVDSSKGSVYLFLNATNQTYTVTLNYVVENGVQIYQDVADLYWKFIDSDWQAASQDVSITVALPVPQNTTIQEGSTIRAWSHGPSDTQISVSDQGIVFLSFQNAKEGNYAEERVVFPAEWVKSGDSKLANHHTNTTQLDTILAQERSWKDSDSYWTGRTYYTVFAAVFVAALILGLGIFSIRRFKRENKSDFNEPYWYKAPAEGVPAAVVSRLLHDGKSSTDDLVVGIMTLVSKGIVSVDKIDGQKNNNLEFKLLVPFDYGFENDIDLRTVTLLFTEIAQGNTSVTLNQIKDFLETNPAKAKEAINTWNGALSARFDNEDYFESYWKIRYPRLIAIALVGIIALIICFIVTNHVLALVPGIIAYLLVLLAARPIGRISVKGLDVLAHLDGLKRWFNELTNLNHSAITSEEKSWSELYIYAYLLGVTQTTQTKLSQAVPEGVADEKELKSVARCSALANIFASKGF